METHKVICPSCGDECRLMDSKTVYGKSYGLIYRCHKCDTHVGCHKKTGKPLGTPAGPLLRRVRREVHKAFDQLWKRDVFGFTRSQAYRWLSKRLGMPKRECHIGSFDMDQCTDALRVIYAHYPELMPKNVRVQQ